MATTARFWAAQFVDGNGNPYSGVKVYHYTSGTTSDLDVYRDKGKTTTDTQPVQGDSQGVVWFYGDGNYRLRIVSKDDILLYDWEDVQLTGTRSGTPKAIVFYGSDNEQTEDTSFLYDSANKRMAVGTPTNLTERIVMPSNSFLGAERSTAGPNEGARKLIGLNSSDQVSINPDGLDVLLATLNANGLLHLNASNLLASLVSSVNGAVPIGSASGVPVWALPTAGAGIGITGTAGGLTITNLSSFKFARATSDVSYTSSTALASHTELKWAVAANETWIFVMGVRYEGGTAGDYKVAFDIPSGTTGFFGVIGPGIGVTGAVGAADKITFDNTTTLTTAVSLGGAGAADEILALLIGWCITSGTAGNMTFQAAQDTSSATASKTLTGSFLIANKILT